MFRSWRSGDTGEDGTGYCIRKWGGRGVKEVTRAVRGPSPGMGRDGGRSSIWAWAGQRLRAARRYSTASAEAVVAGARSGVVEIRESGCGTRPGRKSCGRHFRACLSRAILLSLKANQYKYQHRSML